MTDRDQQVELGKVLLGRAKNPEAIASAVGMWATVPIHEFAKSLRKSTRS